jgi:hypothetical protein
MVLLRCMKENAWSYVFWSERRHFDQQSIRRVVLAVDIGDGSGTSSRPGSGGGV